MIRRQSIMQLTRNKIIPPRKIKTVHYKVERSMRAVYNNYNLQSTKSPTNVLTVLSTVTFYS